MANEIGKIFAVDFDGVIVTDEYPNIGNPNKHAIDKLKIFKEHGDIIILWTCRVGEKLEEAIEWCKKNGIEFDYVNENVPYYVNLYGSDSRKIFADYYIDDKNASFVEKPEIFI